MRRNLIYCLSLLYLLSGFAARADLLQDALPEDISSPSVYAYFNINESGGDSSLTLDEFKRHIEEIQIGNYTVLSLNEILSGEDGGVAFPPNTISVTFDEPDDETYAVAIPLLVENNIPVAIFISPGNADEDEWDRLRRLKRNPLVTIGMTSFTYSHLGNWTGNAIFEDMNRAKALYRENLGADPEFFSYPFGEYSSQFVDIVRRSGFRAAFGQNSGVVTALLDRMKLPRFTMTDDFGDIERFRTTSSSMPFPVKDVEPDVTYVRTLPNIGFTIDERIPGDQVAGTSCFASGEEQPEMSLLASRRVELRFRHPPRDDRLRINCTISVPGEFPDDDPRLRWLSFLLYFPSGNEEIASPMQAAPMQSAPVQAASIPAQP